MMSDVSSFLSWLLTHFRYMGELEALHTKLATLEDSLRTKEVENKQLEASNQKLGADSKALLEKMASIEAASKQEIQGLLPRPGPRTMPCGSRQALTPLVVVFPWDHFSSERAAGSNHRRE
jgi:hypothetical protein